MQACACAHELRAFKSATHQCVQQGGQVGANVPAVGACVLTGQPDLTHLGVREGRNVNQGFAEESP